MANRHLSRSIVLQTIFERDFMSSVENVWDRAKVMESLERNLSEFAPGLEEDSFVLNLTEAVLDKRSVIDEIIKKAAPEWPIEKISVVDRNILRIGLAELLFGDRKDVPPKVAINEAIELAKTFGGENSSKFVNGVLGSVYKELGEPGKEETSKKKIEEKIDKSTLPVHKLGGALVYANHNGKTLFALVHDVFGYWTLSKGKIGEEDPEQGTIKEIKQEIGLDIEIKQKLGENEYVATHPEEGKILKKVIYFLAQSSYKDIKLEPSGGLDDARWFELREIPDLRIYNDVIPIIMKAIEIIGKKPR